MEQGDSARRRKGNRGLRRIMNIREATAEEEGGGEVRNSRSKIGGGLA